MDPRGEPVGLAGPNWTTTPLSLPSSCTTYPAFSLTLPTSCYVCRSGLKCCKVPPIQCRHQAMLVP